MSSYTARVTVPGDGRLVIDLPEEMASGDVEVTVTPCSNEQSERPFPQLAPMYERWERETAAGRPPSDEERNADFDALMREWDSFETELPPRGSSAALLLLDRQFERGGWRGTNRTKEEIDQSIRDLRDEWDDD